jgi:hypothetical protein
MSKAMNRNRRAIVLVLSLAGIFGSARAADTKPEEIVAKHLDSIGTAEARAAVKSRVVKGTLLFKIIDRLGEVVGTWGRVSEQRKSTFVMRFGTGEWRGEQFTSDGEKTSYAATSNHQYSNFAKVVSANDFIVKDGLLGGELTTAWALENLDPNRGRLESLGLKKIDGHEVQGLEYFSKHGTELSVKLYFDPESYRHVKTVYSVVVMPQGSRNGIINSVYQQEVRYTIEEHFSDFQTENGITLPHHYDLQYTEQLQNGGSHSYDWNMTAVKIEDNIGLDPGNFQVK